MSSKTKILESIVETLAKYNDRSTVSLDHIAGRLGASKRSVLRVLANEETRDELDGSASVYFVK
jgi:hypothetical protein